MRATALLFTVLMACGGRGAPASPGVGNQGGAGEPPADTPAGDMPAEVETLVGRWELCVHWAGEEPYDAERRAEIEQGIADSCTGNEETRTSLEARYADRPDILARLRALDDM